MKLETGQNPFDFYRLAPGLSRVAENTNICRGEIAKLRKCFINIAELLQICRKTPEFLFCLSFVSLVWTRPYKAIADKVSGNCASKCSAVGKAQ
jgi:hypothetical protein